MTKLPEPNVTGVCPYCGHDVVFLEPSSHKGSHIYNLKMEYSEPKDTYSEKMFLLVGSRCPNKKCGKLILIRKKIVSVSHDWEWKDDVMIWPRGITRHAPKDVPKEIAKLYEEAYKVLNLSKAAVAVLVRRCLEDIIHDKTQQKEWRLEDGIETIKPDLPDQLKGKPTLARILGNIGSHSKRDAKTGMVIEVDREEAEFILDFIEQLFDHYYVQPAKDQKFQNRITTKYSRINQSKKRPANKK